MYIPKFCRKYLRLSDSGYLFSVLVAWMTESTDQGRRRDQSTSHDPFEAGNYCSGHLKGKRPSIYCNTGGSESWQHNHPLISLNIDKNCLPVWFHINDFWKFVKSFSMTSLPPIIKQVLACFPFNKKMVAGGHVFCLNTKTLKPLYFS
jgi:hypothetical protein